MRGLADAQVWGCLGLVETNPSPQRRLLADPQNQAAAYPQSIHASACRSLKNPITCSGSFVCPSAIGFTFIEHLFYTMPLPSQVHSDKEMSSGLFASSPSP